MSGSRQARRRGERGQVLVIFALGLVAIVAMTGLVLDGGDTFVRRRDQQNVADHAAMAAGYAYGMSNGSAAAAASAAWSTSASNGYTNLADGVSVSVSLDAAGGGARHITVAITKPHQNHFAGIVGLSSWNVTTTATVEAGWANGVVGAMPIIFNQKAFAHGKGPDNEFTYSEPPPGSEDVPKTADTFNWTMYCNDCNADSSTVDTLIRGHGTNTVVDLSFLITPLNAGSHATLYSTLATYAVGTDFPVPLVDDNGLMVGFVMFHLTGSVGGDTKQIRGYFTGEVNPSAMTITSDAPPGIGTYVVKLTN